MKRSYFWSSYFAVVLNFFLFCIIYIFHCIRASLSINYVLAVLPWNIPGMLDFSYRKYSIELDNHELQENDISNIVLCFYDVTIYLTHAKPVWEHIFPFTSTAQNKSFFHTVTGKTHNLWILASTALNVCKHVNSIMLLSSLFTTKILMNTCEALGHRN